MASNSNSSGGIGLFGALFIVFLVLKLCNVIDWSWWIVTLPLWGPIAIVLVIAFITLAAMGICSLGDRR